MRMFIVLHYLLLLHHALYIKWVVTLGFFVKYLCNDSNHLDIQYLYDHKKYKISSVLTHTILSLMIVHEYSLGVTHTSCIFIKCVFHGFTLIVSCAERKLIPGKKNLPRIVNMSRYSFYVTVKYGYRECFHNDHVS